MLKPQEILERLKKVSYPGFSRSVVAFGLIKDVEVGGLGVKVTLSPTTDNQSTIAQIREEIAAAIRELGVEKVEFAIEEPPRGGMAAARPKPKIGQIKRIIAVASGKGGVGKSTVATNLALALRGLGREVGLLDADIYGPSIPVMLGLRERPRADEQKRIEPAERHGIRAISMGLFVDEAKPVIWRGPMISKVLNEFLQNVLWGDLDYLVIDLPPGTGDAQLTICQQVPLSGGVIVTTPQEVALLDVKRGVTMFRDANVPVLGVVENMSYHECRKCGHRADLFGTGGGQQMAQQFEVPFLGSIPLTSLIREGGDQGTPIVASAPDHAQSLAFVELARRVETEVEKIAARPESRPFAIH